MVPKSISFHNCFSFSCCTPEATTEIRIVSNAADQWLARFRPKSLMAFHE